MQVHLDEGRIQRQYRFVQSQKHGWRKTNILSTIHKLKLKFFSTRLKITVNLQRQEGEYLQESLGT